MTCTALSASSIAPSSGYVCGDEFRDGPIIKHYFESMWYRWEASEWVISGTDPGLVYHQNYRDSSDIRVRLPKNSRFDSPSRSRSRGRR
jgi:hypothetical protein